MLFESHIDIERDFIAFVPEISPDILRPETFDLSIKSP